MNSERIKRTSLSPTVKIAARAIAMKRERIDVVDLSVGEPDFPTPQHIKDAAIQALNRDLTKYTVNRGIYELREAICGKLERDNQLRYHPDEIIVSNGAKQCLFNVIQTVVNPGDEVIFPAPYWVSYPEMVKLAGGVPVIIPTSEDTSFKMTPPQLQNAISAATRALIICNPSNPTGSVYTREELAALADVIVKEDIIVIADEIYEKLVYDNLGFTSIAAADSRMKERTVVINGMSKAYAMTGWRVGYAAGPKEIIDGADIIQSHSTSNPGTISQYAGLTALNGPQYEISRMRAEFEKRRNFVLHQLEKISGIFCEKPAGAFYVFPNISSYFGMEYDGTLIRNSYGLAYFILREARVALIPGAAFGSDGNIRISYATSLEVLEEGFNRLSTVLKKLKTPARVKSVRLNNTRTRRQTHLPVTSDMTLEKREALVAEAEDQLSFDSYFEWNANINGIIIQLRTNQPHLYDFWMDNWYPAQLETDLEPHGIIYAVDGVTGREPYAFYHSESNTAVVFNTDYYYSLRSIALGIAADISERLNGGITLRAFTADFQGLGFALTGPKGTKKTELFYRLIRRDAVAFHSHDLSFVRRGGGITALDLPERKIYIPTETAGIYERLGALFERCRCENVVTGKDHCTRDDCAQNDDCMLDRGLPYCFTATGTAHALLDPYWIGGMAKHVKRIDLQAFFLLRNEISTRVIDEISQNEMLRILSQTDQSAPFFNHHMLIRSSEHIEFYRQAMESILSGLHCYLVNTAAAPEAETEEQIIKILEKM